jgi:hypothetical protein
MKQKFIIIIFLALFTVVFCANFAQAGSATISWNANAEPDLAGYKIYYGTSPRTGTNPGSATTQPLPKCGLCGYSTSVNVGNVRTYTFSNLTNNTTYYFSISAYDTSNNESAFSSQVSKLISKTADLNSDGLVNMQDASVLMANWGATTRPRADVNQDGYVNMQDASIMMAQWGS